MKNKLFSSFLGGFFGILLSGYAYYLGGKHQFYLIPIGTFLGSLIGFSWYNLKEIMDKTSALAKRWRLWEPRVIFRPMLKLYILTRKKLQKISFNGVFKFFEDITRIVLIIFRVPRRIFQKINFWLKAHPMNKYVLGEIITLTAIGVVLIQFILQSGVLQIPLPEIYKIGIGIPVLASCLSVIICFILISERSLESFYASWQFYDRYRMLGVITKMLSTFVIMTIAMVILITVILTTILLLIGYGFTIFIASLVIIAIVALIVYVLRLINDYREASALVITMAVTTISYFLYRNLFSEELMIWLVAFGTGCISSFSVWLFLIFNNGWILKKMEKAYQFLTNDDSDMEKVETYHLSWTGLMLFMPVNLAAKLIWPKIDHSSLFLIETVTIKIR